MLKIDCSKIVREIEKIIEAQVYTKFKKRGAVIGISGGLDSSVTAALCARALGADNILGVILPEKESANVSGIYAKRLARGLRIKVKQQDITPVLDAFGIYKIREKIVKKYFPAFRPSDYFRVVMPGDILKTKQLNAPCLEIKDGRGRAQKVLLSASDYLQMIAATNVKHRIRMTALYYYAEQNNYLVAGTTNLTEYLLGFFVKYGDGGADIDPIRHLYKTQVYQLAKYLKVPDSIIDRDPTPDTFSYPVSDEKFYFRLPYEKLDLLLGAFIRHVPLRAARKNLGMTSEQLRRVFFDFKSKYRVGEYLRRGAIQIAK